MGRKCMPWNQAPNVRTANHAELLGGHNFCRNPGASYPQPWCFAYDNNVPVKELCYIPECGELKTLNAIYCDLVAKCGCSLVISEDAKLQSVFIGIAGAVFTLFLLLCYFCCSRRKSRQRKRDQISSNKFKVGFGKLLKLWSFEHR